MHAQPRSFKFSTLPDLNRKPGADDIDDIDDIDDAVKQAVTEHSLNPQSIETSIRKALLPTLFAAMGLDKAKAVIEQVIPVTRVGLGRSAF